MSALVLAKDSVRQVLEVGRLGAAVNVLELGVRVHLRLLGLARLPLGRRQQEAVALQERDCVLAALVALLAPLQLEVLGARVRQQLDAGLLLLVTQRGALLGLVTVRAVLVEPLSVVSEGRLSVIVLEGGVQAKADIKWQISGWSSYAAIMRALTPMLLKA